MATTKDFADFVCECVRDFGEITSRKMFGEYMVYINAKPVLLLCDNVLYVKMKDEIKEYMQDAEIGYPYNGAKMLYVLDVENQDLIGNVLPILENITAIPKSKKKK